MFNNKILSQDSLFVISETLHKNDKKIVTTNGSYDLIHFGHVKSLEFSKFLGDILIVGVNSDQSVKGYKGPNRPLISEEERAYMVASLECVNYVCVFDEIEIGCPLIKIVKPHVHTTAMEWGENCPESKIVKDYKTQLVLIPKFKSHSTTELIEKIVKLSGEPSKTLEEKKNSLERS